MKVAVAVLVLCVSFSLTLPVVKQDEIFSSFVSFKSEFNKVYSSEDEAAFRFGVFQQNLDIIAAHNQRFEAGEVSYSLGLNQFADMTDEEYASYLNFRASGRNMRAMATHEARSDLPESVDWTQHTPKVVSSPKDQGACGSCWAFSATGAMEAVHALKTGQLDLFSEQELVDCVNDGADDCVAGGEMWEAFELAMDLGMESEAAYPYTAKSLKECKYDASKGVTKFTSYVNVTVYNEPALQAAVAEVPGVSVAIDAGNIGFKLYKTGVYDEPSCHTLRDELNHGVLAVGYGSENGMDYWLVKNSWGTGWGDHGFIKMRRNADNQCGIATCASYPVA